MSLATIGLAAYLALAAVRKFALLPESKIFDYVQGAVATATAVLLIVGK